MPLERAILWRPRGVTGATFPEGLYPMFLEHDLLAGVNRHLDRVEREPRFGFLLGRLYHCPETDVDYAVADTAVAAREILSEEASGAYVIRAWSEAQAVFSGHSGLLLGWYHSHYRFGLMPTEADRDTIARYFDAPWQLSIIVVPDRARPLGAVFRTLPAEAGGDHDRPAAFYELSPAPHGGDIGRPHSAVTWANYQAHPPAPPVFGPAEEFAGPRDEPAVEAVAEEKVAEDEIVEEEAVEEGAVEHVETVEEVAEEPPTQAVEEAEAEEAPDETPQEETASDAKASGEAPPVSEHEPPPAEPRVSLSERAGTLAPDASSEPSGVRMPRPKAADPPGDFPASQEPRPPNRPMPPGSQSVRGVPLVMPGEKADVNLLPPRSRRIRWRVVATAAALLAVALFLLWPDPPTASTGRPGPEPSSSAGDGPVSPELRQFLEDVDALEIAGERYGERAADFDAGRIGCDLLTTGYVAADEAYVRVASAYGNPEVRSNPRSADAYEEAGAEIADINSHFDGSGCPRP
ncbi:MAG TPA: hypothetical protein VLA33_06315 [Gemmatimonadota bacterium]|nr:hypothetical protein [Gemmatimonadota bacterium]